MRALLSLSCLTLLASACCPPEQSSTLDAGVVECVPYTPATINGTESGTFVTADAKRSLPIAVTDRGGGLVEVRVSASHATVAEVRLQGRPDAELHAGVSVRVSDDVAERRFVFRAHGGRTYDVELKPLATPPQGGQTWAASWSYQPNVDCFEPNDTEATAKRILLDTPVQAFAHAGIIEGDGVLVGPSLTDFYRFELTAPTTVQLAATRPGDEGVVFEFWNGATHASYLVATDVMAASNVESTSEELALPAGTHYVRVAAFVSQDSSRETTPGTPPFPQTWNQPYTFTVLRKAR
ncbi:MAG: hypothetical protein ACOZQL_14345 [Myxococcota bacterium]